MAWQITQKRAAIDALGVLKVDLIAAIRTKKSAHDVSRHRSAFDPGYSVSAFTSL
jgi:hypothetical protein